MASTSNYHHLVTLYDELFPLNPEVLVFLDASLGGTGGRRIVDAGCGTGLLARALCDRGAIVHGFDLDPALLAVARTRQTGGCSFDLADLRDFMLPAEWGSSDALVCLGNTLPHLTTDDDVDRFLSRAAAILVTGGIFVLQTLDYDFLRSSGTLALPDRRVGGVTFRRAYEVRPDGLWAFRTTLESAGGVSSAVFPLRPWGRSDLEAALVRHGFTLTGAFGDFDRRAPGASLPLVLEARLA